MNCTKFIVLQGRYVGPSIPSAYCNSLLRTYLSKPGVFNLHLGKGHILMAERFAGSIHVLQSKVCMLLQDMRTNASLHKHT
jgi:hypothetical protein